MQEEMLEAIENMLLRPDTLGLCVDAELRAKTAVSEVLSCSCGCDDTEDVKCGKCATYDLRTLIKCAVEPSPLVDSSLHGWTHWMGVYRNAIMIAQEASLHLFDPTVDDEYSPKFDFTACAMLFALFHDCRRVTEGADLTHGAYGSMALMSAMNTLQGVAMLTPEWAVASFSCNMHTVVDYPLMDSAFIDIPDLECMLDHKDAKLTMQRAIGMCLDADRIELLRLGRPPLPEYLYHHNAVERVVERLWKGGAYDTFY